MAAPGGLTLSPDGKQLYVVDNNANNVVTIDTATNAIAGSAAQVGFFPYAATVAGGKLYVTNDGVAERAFSTSAIASEVVSSGGTNAFGSAALTGTVSLTGTKYIGGGTTGNLFANPATDGARSSSVFVLKLNGDGSVGGLKSAVSLLLPIDGINVVGGTQPTGMALVGSTLYVADANEDALALIDTSTDKLLGRLQLGASVGLPTTVRGLVPNALAFDSTHQRLFVTEAGINAVAVYDVSDAIEPLFEGLLPTGWYPSGLVLGAGGNELFVINAKGVGNDLGFHGSTSTAPDVNLVFGTAQKVDVSGLTTDALASSTKAVLSNNFRASRSASAGILPTLQTNVKHIVYILRENKSYDSYFGSDAKLNAKGARGRTPPPNAVDWGSFTSSTIGYTSTQVPNTTGNLVQNTRALAEQFNLGDNFFADSEESDAGHSFALAGTASDYMEKTLLQRGSRGLISVKNEDPEDYPLAGFIFNNAARSNVSYKDYGDLIRISGYDDGNSSDACANDPALGSQTACPVTTTQAGQDILSATAGLGGLYTENLPALLALGGHIDQNYPGWNVHITDQRRAAEFIKDFGKLISAGKAPALTFVWLPEDHTGNSGGSNFSPAFQVLDNDVALGSVVQFISHSSIWHNTAIFVTADDAQSSWDHVYAHRTYAMVISPWAKHGQVIHSRGSTVSIPKTIEEILGMSPMNYGDLLGNDMLSYFTSVPDDTPFTPAKSTVSLAGLASVAPEVGRISALSNYLNMSTYDLDNQRLGNLTALYMQSSQLALRRGTMSTQAYKKAQDSLYASARSLVGLR
jgi:YVTN family beta-propeller protein